MHSNQEKRIAMWMETHVSSIFKLAAVFSLTYLFAISKEYERRDAIDEVLVTHCLQSNV